MWLWAFFGIVLVFGLVVFRGAPYVPTRKRELEQAFNELYPLSEADLLVDIGSGDGVVLRAAAKKGARAVGYELNPILVLISRILNRNFKNKITVHLADFWLVSFPPETTIVYTFGESRDIEKMYKKITRESTRLGKPLYFISYGFEVPSVTAKKSKSGFVLYEVAP